MTVQIHPFIHLDHVEIIPRLMKKLPLDIAQKYQALPVGNEAGRITIAMAHPEEPTARYILSNIFGRKVFFVHADPAQIKKCLNVYSSNSSADRLKSLVFVDGHETPDQLGFLKYIKKYLKADWAARELTSGGFQHAKSIIRQISDSPPDLLIFFLSKANTFNWLKIHKTINKCIKISPACLLVPTKPAYPFQQLLLGVEDKKFAPPSFFPWLKAFTAGTDAQVNILPFLPQIPVGYGNFIQYNLAELTISPDPLGEKLRQIASFLSDNQIQGAFHLKEGNPASQLGAASRAIKPELIILSSNILHSNWSGSDISGTLFHCLASSILYINPKLKGNL